MDIKAGVKAGALVLQAPAARPTITEEIKMPFLRFTPIVLLQLTFLAGLNGKSFDGDKTYSPVGVLGICVV